MLEGCEPQRHKGTEGSWRAWRYRAEFLCAFDPLWFETGGGRYRRLRISDCGIEPRMNAHGRKCATSAPTRPWIVSMDGRWGRNSVPRSGTVPAVAGKGLRKCQGATMPTGVPECNSSANGAFRDSVPERVETPEAVDLPPSSEPNIVCHSEVRRRRTRSLWRSRWQKAKFQPTTESSRSGTEEATPKHTEGTEEGGGSLPNGRQPPPRTDAGGL